MNAIAEPISFLQYASEQVVTEFDHETSTHWIYMNPRSRPCFNRDLLLELNDTCAQIENNAGCVMHQGRLQPIQFSVFASKTPGVFNLGGDLASFRAWVQRGDRAALLDYATRCIDNIWARINHYNAPILTISLVQGQALGGGFEAALSSQVIIAERSSRMGLPEILFNLFPGMGAYSLIGRRLGARKAEEIILSGKIYSAEELQQIGLVDIVAEDGQGEIAVYEFIKKHQRMRNGYQAVMQARNRFSPVTYDELMDITKIWVEAALRLEERDLKMMERLVRGQDRLSGKSAGFGQGEELRHAS